MKKIFTIFLTYLRKVNLRIKRHVEDSGAQYIAFGIFGVLNYPLSYFVWRDVLQQSYNPLSLRMIAAGLCVPLILKNHWPKTFRPLLPSYWYLTLLYCLPFFGTFMLLKNQVSNDLLMNNVLGLFLLMLLVDWRSFILLIIGGVSMGWLAYSMTGGAVLAPINKDAISLAIYMYLFAIIIGGVFSRNKEKIAREKLTTIKAIGESIAHELRTPLRTIHMSASGIKDYLPSLIKTYAIAKDAKLDIPYIDEARYEILIRTLDNIVSEVDSSFIFINMLLTNVNPANSNFHYHVCSISYCIEQSLLRYPFDNSERELIVWDRQSDFSFKGDEQLMIHIIFNLLRNSFYYIKASGKGQIFIWLESGGPYNKVHFKDTGQGISRKILPYIFDRFFSDTYHGTGIGLAFCKTAMENFDGDITVQSVEGDYAEFILHFPNKLSREYAQSKRPVSKEIL